MNIEFASLALRVGLCECSREGLLVAFRKRPLERPGSGAPCARRSYDIGLCVRALIE